MLSLKSRRWLRQKDEYQLNPGARRCRAPFLFPMAIDFKKTGFTGNFIRENGLNEDDFRDWVLYGGMLFRSSYKWWGDRGRRSIPHEGLDLSLYRNHEGRIYQITRGMNIPVIYEGIVAGIFHDFIGKSIIVMHSTPCSGNKVFCTIYGHTAPIDDICTGRTVRSGEIIATVAGTSGPEAVISTHLHISIGYPAFGEISYNTLNWNDIGDTKKITLIDPLQVIDRYIVMRDEH